MNKSINAGENMIKVLKVQIDKQKEIGKKYNVKDLEELKDKLMALQQIDAAEKAKDQLKFAEDNLKELKKDRLALEPVIKQLPKK